MIWCHKISHRILCISCATWFESQMNVQETRALYFSSVIAVIMAVINNDAICYRPWFLLLLCRSDCISADLILDDQAQFPVVRFDGQSHTNQSFVKLSRYRHVASKSINKSMKLYQTPNQCISLLKNSGLTKLWFSLIETRCGLNKIFRVWFISLHYWISCSTVRNYARLCSDYFDLTGILRVKSISRFVKCFYVFIQWIPPPRNQTSATK